MSLLIKQAIETQIVAGHIKQRVLMGVLFSCQHKTLLKWQPILGNPGYEGNKLLSQIHARNNPNISISRQPFLPYPPYAM